MVRSDYQKKFCRAKRALINAEGPIWKLGRRGRKIDSFFPKMNKMVKQVKNNSENINLVK